MENTIKAGTQVKVVSGNRYLGLAKGAILTITEVIPLGADFSHQVKVRFTHRGIKGSLAARHINRLSDPVLNLNNGDPTRKIQVVYYRTLPDVTAAGEISV